MKQMMTHNIENNKLKQNTSLFAFIDQNKKHIYNQVKTNSWKHMFMDAVIIIVFLAFSNGNNTE